MTCCYTVGAIFFENQNEGLNHLKCINFDDFNCRTASSTIDNNIDVSIEVKIYSETSFRLRNMI